MPAVNHEPTIRPRGGKLRQGVHGLLVLGEQRDLVQRDHVVPRAPRSPVGAGNGGDRGEGEQTDGTAPIEDREVVKRCDQATSSMKRPVVESASTVTGWATIRSRTRKPPSACSVAT
jgi:hypothetical protein